MRASLGSGGLAFVWAVVLFGWCVLCCCWLYCCLYRATRKYRPQGKTKATQLRRGGIQTSLTNIDRKQLGMSLKRLVEDVFAGDVCGQFADYCREEPTWGPAVALLDEGGGAGWKLVQQLVACREPASEEAEGASCERLLASPWFDGVE